MDLELPIELYHDECFLAVDKPSGMLVHRGWGRDDVVLVDLVKKILNEDVVHPIHRLDRGTSGVMLFAKSAEIAASMQTEFQDGRVKKRYLALVRGVAPESGEIDHPIPRRTDGPRVDAFTTYRRLAFAETEPRHVSLVEAIPKTGRLHQVRRHLKHINHPIMGDSKYGKGVLNRAMSENYNLRRLALHAARLSFTHPLTRIPVEIHSPIPEDLLDPFITMGINFNERRTEQLLP